MNKYILISIMVCAVFLLSSRNVYGQDSKKTVAVLQAEGKSVSDEIKSGITGGLEEGVFKSGEYKLLARGDAYRAAIATIKNDLMEGTVSDDQLIQLGHATGADFVCYATVSKFSDDLFRIAYKMIDVSSSEITNIGSETVRNGMEGMLTATDNIARKLFGGNNSADMQQTTESQKNNTLRNNTNKQKSDDILVANDAVKNLAPVDGKAIVYIIRTSLLGALFKIEINCDDQKIGSTKAKQYVYTILNPGRHTFISKAENKASLDVTLEAGKIYYIKQQVKMGLLSGRTGLELMNDSDGRNALNDCKLSSDNIYSDGSNNK